MGNSPQTGTLNQVSPQFGQLISNYLGTTAPAIQSLTSGAGSAYAGSQAPVSSDANALENINTSGLSGLDTSSLTNFQALTPANIAALSSGAGAAVESAGQTAASTSGGVPNQALQNKNLSISAGQQAGQTATSLGNIAADQKLGATTAAVSDTLQGKEAATSDTLQGLASGGGLLAGLSAEDLSALTSALGLGTSALQTGTSGQLDVANQQGQATAAKNNAIGSGLGGAANLGTTIATGGLSSGGSGGKSGGGGGNAFSSYADNSLLPASNPYPYANDSYAQP